MLLLRALCLISALLVGQPVLAAPTVFVPIKPGYAWEIRDLIFRPKAKSDGGVSVDAINEFIKARIARKAVSQSFQPICLMNFVTVSDVVSSDRDTQKEIDHDLGEYPKSFFETWSTGGEKFNIRVGVFEDCPESNSKQAAEPLGYMALVITDASGAVREFDTLDWNLIRLFKRDDGKINILGCFACGEVRELNYDVGNKKFYFEWIGH